MKDPVDALLASRLFQGISETGLATLALAMEPRTLANSEPLFNEGDPSDAMWVLVQGSVQLTTRRKEGERCLLGTVQSPDALGELALLREGGRRQCTAAARGPVEALVLSGVAFRELASQKPQLCAKVILLISQGMAGKWEEQTALLRAALHRP